MFRVKVGMISGDGGGGDGGGGGDDEGGVIMLVMVGVMLETSNEDQVCDVCVMCV